MTYAPTQLSFNAAFLREIKEDNQRVRELFHEVATMLTAPRREMPERIARQLWQLRDQLAMHFALENAFGYLAHVVDFAPRLCDRAKSMIAQHDELFLSLCEIIEIAEEVMYGEREPSRFVDVARPYFAFQRRFYEHEAEENALLFDVFDDDIGVGD
jgi:hypothetical protein